MPLYEYKCTNCNTVFEELVTKDQESPLKCPSCGSDNTEKKMSAAGISTGTYKEPACTSSCPSASSGCASGGCPMQQN